MNDIGLDDFQKTKNAWHWKAADFDNREIAHSAILLFFLFVKIISMSPILFIGLIRGDFLVVLR